MLVVVDRWRLRDHLLGVLSKAQKERPKLQAEVQVSPNRWEFAWVTYERLQMLSAVNIERAKRGLSLLTAEDIQRVEQMALGHSDYSLKFALYCMELALGEKVHGS